MKKTLIATLIAGVALAAGQASAGLDFDQRSAFNPAEFDYEAATSTDLGTGFVRTFSESTGLDADGTKYQTTATDKKVGWNFGTNVDVPVAVDSTLEIETYYSDNSASTFAQGGLSPSSDGSWDAGEYWTITRLTQFNEFIAGYGTPLWSAEIDNITGISQDGIKLSDDETTDAFSFYETNNFPAGGVGACDPAPGIFGGDACPDYYLALESILDPVQFVSPLDGHTYVIDFRIIGVQNAEIFDLGDGGLFGVLTPEIANNESIVDIQARYTKVPVPGTLALLGLGLAGLGFRNRRKNG